MRVLLTNDDGYLARGIHELYKALSDRAEVKVVVPDRERSATGMGLTLTEPLRVRDIPLPELPGKMVNGTPADCVKMGISYLLQDKQPDFVFSGINHGSNTGLNALYSGTVAGAVEGAMNGIPSIAVSIASFQPDDYTVAVRAALNVLDRVQDFELQPFELLSVNVPPIPMKDIKGLRVTRVAHVMYREAFDRRIDARNNEYFWMGGEWVNFGVLPDGDETLLREGYVTVTPLRMDITAEERLTAMRKAGWDEEWQAGEQAGGS
ncbi:5'/3'-nucleotidase SurE [bacterium]|nr:5'/3'-nucleotidase SurE [bacterium]